MNVTYLTFMLFNIKICSNLAIRSFIWYFGFFASKFVFFIVFWLFVFLRFVQIFLDVHDFILYQSFTYSLWSLCFYNDYNQVEMGKKNPMHNENQEFH